MNVGKQVSGLRVKCPNCKRVMFETTHRYNPDVRPDGSMVKWLGPYHLDWLTTSTTLCSELSCPECLAQLAPSGRLVVFAPASETQETAEIQEEAGVEDQADAVVEKPKFTCDICNDGRVFKNWFALDGHKKTHAKGIKDAETVHRDT